MVCVYDSKYVFFGSPEFAAIILEKLIKAGLKPEIVVCNPDRPVGRKKIISPPPTKVLAEKYGIKVFQPETLANFEFRISNFEFFVVASYSKIIPKEILEIPKLGVIGVHPSLLPKFRGPSPIQTSILQGDEDFGVSLFLVDEKIDHGPILAKRELEIQNSKFEILNRKLAELGADLLIEILPKFLKKEITPLPQDETQATYTEKFATEHGFVDLKKDSPVIIERKIRALNPEPGIYTFLSQKEIETLLGYKIADFSEQKRVKLLNAEIKNDKLILLEIQVQGKKLSKCRVI